MRTAGNRTAVALLAVLSSHSALADEPDPAYQRSLTLGVTSEVEQMVLEQPTAHSTSVLLTEASHAEVRQPPPECGLDLSKHYQSMLRSEFDIIALSTCNASPSSIDCPSEKLDENSNLFLRLTYEHRPGEVMTLELAAFHLDALGDPVESQISRDRKFAFADLWDQLQELAFCEQ